MPERIILIRHALSVADPDVDSREWGLAPGAAAEAERLATMLPDDIADTIWTSAERKAIDTANAIADERGLRVEIDDRFGEVRRPWTGNAGDYRGTAIRYLSGDPVEGWEVREDVVWRFGQAVAEIAPGRTGVVVDHGLAMSLYVGSVTTLDIAAFWSALTFPDAWSIQDGVLTRVFER